MTRTKDLRFERLVSKYETSDVVRQMDSYFHHGDTTTLEHSRNVAWTSYQLNKKWNLHADEKSLVASAMLHDLYLYDRHDDSHSRIEHRYHHPEVACENAERFFDLTEKEKSSIRSHMWPLNLRCVPQSKEALILCMVDKYCAAVETLQGNRAWNFAHRKKDMLLHYVR